jgi:hypothetical protein
MVSCTEAGLGGFIAGTGTEFTCVMQERVIIGRMRGRERPVMNIGTSLMVLGWRCRKPRRNKMYFFNTK